MPRPDRDQGRIRGLRWRVRAHLLAADPREVQTSLQTHSQGQVLELAMNLRQSFHNHGEGFN